VKREKKYTEYTEFENMLVGRLAGELSRRFGLSRQEQEDAEQEFAMRLWTKKAEYDKKHPSRSSYEAYMTRCLEKRSLEVLKAVRPETNLKEIGESAAEIKISSLIEKRDASTESIAMFRAHLGAAFSKFTPEQKELFARVGYGETIAEISADTGVPRTTIYARLHRMRLIYHDNGLNVAANKYRRKEVSHK
jgi:RNA polymerase sigma factor (sigma-70 family)